MPQATSQTEVNPKDNPALGQELEPIAGPPEEEFWDKYNRRMEFPLATVATVLLHVIVGAILIYVLVGLMDGEENREGPPVQLSAVGGLDDSGDGSAGSGGQENPDLIKDVDPYKALKDSLPTPESIADAKADIQKLLLDDVGKLPISAPNANAYSKLDKTVAEKLLGVGGRKGDGNQAGSGFDGTPGKGPGGTGADSTRARGLRWVLRFRIASGADYVAQLKAMRAEILVPLPPDDKKCVLIADLDNPSSQRVATDADLRRLGGKIQFSDTRREQVRDVVNTLGVQTAGQPKTFWAFFPKDLEEELARKETGYRNRRAEDIEETIFRVTIRGGTFEIVVDDQVAKK